MRATVEIELIHDKAPSVVLGDFHKALAAKYGDKAKKQNRSINVDFGVKADADDNTDYRLISVDVVPALSDAPCLKSINRLSHHQH